MNTSLAAHPRQMLRHRPTGSRGVDDALIRIQQLSEEAPHAATRAARDLTTESLRPVRELTSSLQNLADAGSRHARRARSALTTMRSELRLIAALPSFLAYRPAAQRALETVQRECVNAIRNCTVHVNALSTAAEEASTQARVTATHVISQIQSATRNWPPEAEHTRILQTGAQHLHDAITGLEDQTNTIHQLHATFDAVTRHVQEVQASLEVALTAQQATKRGQEIKRATRYSRRMLAQAHVQLTHFRIQSAGQR